MIYTLLLLTLDIVMRNKMHTVYWKYVTALVAVHMVLVSTNSCRFKGVSQHYLQDDLVIIWK